MQSPELQINREVASSPRQDRKLTMAASHQRFCNFQLQEEYDTYDPKDDCSMELPVGKNRSKIIEIVAAQDIVFTLDQSGVSSAYSRETNRRVCFLNLSRDEVVRSLFYNKYKDSLITVSVYALDHCSSLKCRSTRIEDIKRGNVDAGIPIFESEKLKWPGFVEFDDVNGKAVTFSAEDSSYKVFDMKSYLMLYSIPGENVQDIKISPGVMLLIFNRSTSHVPLRILSIEDGTVLKSFNHLLHRNKKVDFIELFNENLLVKQENEDLQILHVTNFALTEVSRTEFMTPSAFIFLYKNQKFLTFRDRTVSVWNSIGEQVASYEDHLLWHPDSSTGNIYVMNDQDLIISYCKDASGSTEIAAAGSINISKTSTGKSVAKITANDYSTASGVSSCTAVAEALHDVTAIFYDEARNEIYTGNKQGSIHVWCRSHPRSLM